MTNFEKIKKLESRKQKNIEEVEAEYEKNKDYISLEGLNVVVIGSKYTTEPYYELLMR